MHGSKFHVEVDEATASAWVGSLDQFADANLYQTWAYGEVRCGAANVSRIVLKRGDATVAMAQLALAGPRRAGIGIAQLRWGPVWTRKGEAIEPGILERMASALRDEYVKRRRLFLRVLPNAYAGTERAQVFQAAFGGYAGQSFRREESYRTLELDLTRPLDVIRKRLDQKWRNQLNRAEKNGLTVRGGDAARFFGTYITMHDEMMARKRFAQSSDVREFERMQERLPEHQKMRILICERDGVPVAGLVGSALGDTGIYLFGATTDQGMQTKGAYLLQWHMIQWLKEQGVAHYDLGGINPQRNPGVYHFKAGLAGNDVHYVTPFVSCESPISKVFVKAASLAGGRVRAAVMRFRSAS